MSDKQQKRLPILCGICLVSLVIMLAALGVAIWLIVTYVTRDHDSDFDLLTTRTGTITMSYASNCVGCRNFDVQNFNSLNDQLTTPLGLSSSLLHLESALFAAAVARARRTVSSNVFWCERPTGMTGDIVAVRFRIVYPVLCYSNACRSEYHNTVRNALRSSYAPYSAKINFTNGETRDVQMKFCIFHSVVNA